MSHNHYFPIKMEKLPSCNYLTLLYKSHFVRDTFLPTTLNPKLPHGNAGQHLHSPHVHHYSPHHLTQQELTENTIPVRPPSLDVDINIVKYTMTVTVTIRAPQLRPHPKHPGPCTTQNCHSPALCLAITSSHPICPCWPSSPLSCSSSTRPQCCP